MRKTLVLAVLALLVLASLPLAQAADSGDAKWTFDGQFRIREEHLENYADFNNNGANDTIDFMPYRALLGVNGQLSNNISMKFQFQSFGVLGFNGDPRQSSSFPPTQQEFTTSPESTNLYQAAVTLNHFIGNNFSVTAGRQEHMEGNGLIFGNEEFYNGTVYDGAIGTWKFKKWELTGLGFIINEGFDPATFGTFTCGTCGSEDKRVWGATGHLHFNVAKTKTDLDVYAYDFYDGMTVVTGVDKPHFNTYGGHWWRMVKTTKDAKEFPLDWSVEAAVQEGHLHEAVTNTSFQLTGAIFDGSVGWNFASGKDMVHRVYIGATSESGDKDLTDNKIKGWTDLFMSVHNRFGAADFFGSNFGQYNAGITAGKVGYVGSMRDGKHQFGITFWSFMPTEDKIKVAPGTTVKVKDYGTEIDAGYKYHYTDNVTFGVGVASLSPKDGLTGGSPNPNDAVLRAVGMLDVKFH
jgi:hypothetical protein